MFVETVAIKHTTMTEKKSQDIPVKILIVDDKESNLLSLQAILHDTGYIFKFAQSGEEALRILLHETDFTLIIMDVIMPEMDGFETASYITRRERLADIPIIFLTARDQDDNVFKAYNVGAVDYISKPVVPDLLRAKVHVFVELSRKNRILEYQKERLREVNDSLEKEMWERKASEEKVKLLNADLTQKLEELEALDSFSYTVSHDLRNPLASLLMLMEFFLISYQSKLDEEGVGIIKRAEGQVRRVEQIVNDLLLFSRHGSKIEREEVDMNEIVKSVLADIAQLYNIEERYQIHVERLPVIQCNGSLIKQVWTNLLSNAVKYSSKEEKPEVKIRVQESDNEMVFVIEDNGIGFDDKSGKLFKVFSRMDSARKFEGTGVGLAIVKRIVDRHGGRIWVDSQVGRGTTFFFTLGEESHVVTSEA